MWEQWGVESLAFPLTWHIAYTTACCYRKSQGVNEPCQGAKKQLAKEPEGKQARGQTGKGVKKP